MQILSMIFATELPPHFTSDVPKISFILQEYDCPVRHRKYEEDPIC